ncbi:MAG: hypothetical protein WC223_01210 [Bacteroidales bacterium]|jgi:hypothetical protein
MKKLMLVAMFLLGSVMIYAQEYLQITTIESVVPGGLGRSRMITTKPDGSTDEVKMENFFSMVGINFDNIRLNDKIITDKITDLTRQGWQLMLTTSGVYGADKSTGIFITRYLFKRDKK